jgi:hypothetical protein
MRSRWSAPDILEPALLRAALPDGEMSLVGWEYVSLWLSLFGWRTHNHATAPTAQTLSSSWRRWGLPAILVRVPDKPGRSILTTNYRLLSHLVAQPRQKRWAPSPAATTTRLRPTNHVPEGPSLSLRARHLRARV